MLVLADAIRRDVLEHHSGVRRRARSPSRTCHPRLRVDDDTGRLDLGGDRREREQCRGRVAAGVRDEPTRWRMQLGKPIRPRGQPIGMRMLESVPLVVEAGIDEPVRSREVDDHTARRDVERRSLFVRQAQESDVGAGSERRVVRDESRDAAPAVAAEAGIERPGRLARERVRPERVQLERRMREHAIQCLLSGVPRRAHYRHSRHRGIMHIDRVSCIHSA